MLSVMLIAFKRLFSDLVVKAVVAVDRESDVEIKMLDMAQSRPSTKTCFASCSSFGRHLPLGAPAQAGSPGLRHSSSGTSRGFGSPGPGLSPGGFALFFSSFFFSVEMGA